MKINKLNWLVLSAAMVVSNASFAKVSKAGVGVMVDKSLMGTDAGSVLDDMRGDVAFANAVLRRNGVKAEFVIESVAEIESKMDVRAGNLLSEVELISSKLNSYENLPMTGLGDYFYDQSVTKSVVDWIKSTPNINHVILLPYPKFSNDCAQTYTDDKYQFTVQYYSFFGECSQNWIFAHELMHQKGLSHSAGGLMAEGLGSENRLSLNKSEIAQLKSSRWADGAREDKRLAKEGLTFSNVKLDIQGGRGVLSAILSNRTSLNVYKNISALVPNFSNLNSEPVRIDAGNVSIPAGTAIKVNRYVKLPIEMMLLKGSDVRLILS